MTSSARAGAVLYAKHPERVVAFYVGVIGLVVLLPPDAWHRRVNAGSVSWLRS